MYEECPYTLMSVLLFCILNGAFLKVGKTPLFGVNGSRQTATYLMSLYSKYLSMF